MKSLYRSKSKVHNYNLSKIFLLSAIFFSFFSFFGVYEYKVYSWWWLVVFYLFELLFYLGLRSGRIITSNRQAIDKQECQFYITNQGAIILSIAIIVSILSFVYFVFSFRQNIGLFIFGTYTANLYQEGRSSFEKATLLLMQWGSESVFLILMADKSERYKKLKLISCFVLFLPGIRFLIMGARFTIATEFLMLFAVKWPQMKEKIKYSAKARRGKRVIICLAIMLGISFLYLFASRSSAVHYTAFERKLLQSGDMKIKPFWEMLYLKTNGKIDFICVLSDYLGEAPFVFSGFCKNMYPDKIYFGQLILRSVMQIINAITGIGLSFGEMVESIASGQYSGFGYVLIADFGILGAFFAAFYIGRIFAIVEKKKNINRTCCVVYIPLKVICFFAPIFYFYVGRLDYSILGCLIFTPICLKRVAVNNN